MVAPTVSLGAVNSEVQTSIVSDVFGALATQSLRTFAGGVAPPAVPAPVAMAVDRQPVDFAPAASCAAASSADFSQAAGTLRSSVGEVLPRNKNDPH